MKRSQTGGEATGGITRRQLMAHGMLGLAGWLFQPLQMAEAALQSDLDLVSLIPQMAHRDTPLLVFRDFTADPDGEVERHLRRQIGQRKDLLSQLKRRFDNERRIALSLEDMHVRLMFVPQSPIDHADAYRRYCQEVTDYIFQINPTDNFYATITTPRQSYPEVAKAGISAFLVHRLAKAYRAVCRFTSESGRQIIYHLSGAIFSNHLGAVDLDIQLFEGRRYGLSRRSFSIWQNHTKNLRTLLSIPVEETLHYLLGQATDRAITVVLKKFPTEDLNAARGIAEEWMAVEESVVGGMVPIILRRFCHRHRLVISPATRHPPSPASPSLPQYRYRDQGHQLVGKIGLQTAMDMYMHDPIEFRDHLLRQPGASSNHPCLGKRGAGLAPHANKKKVAPAGMQPAQPSCTHQRCDRAKTGFAFLASMD